MTNPYAITCTPELLEYYERLIRIYRCLIPWLKAKQNVLWLISRLCPRFEERYQEAKSAVREAEYGQEEVLSNHWRLVERGEIGPIVFELPDDSGYDGWLQPEDEYRPQ